MRTARLAILLAALAGPLHADRDRLAIWSLADTATAPRGTRAALGDIRRAVRAQRPFAVAAAGGIDDYLAAMPLADLDRFKGFMHEASVERRTRARGTLPVTAGPRNHPHIDLLLGGETVQVYSGKSPAVAMEKLLGSDRLAGRLSLPRDVHERIIQTLDECEALWRRIDSGELDAVEGRRQIGRRARKIGLVLERDALVLPSGEGLRAKLGAGQLAELRRKLQSDHWASAKIQQRALQARLHADPDGYGRLYRLLGKSDDALLALRALERRHAPLPIGKHAGLQQQLHRAVLLGLPSTEASAIVQHAGDLDDAAAKLSRKLFRIRARQMLAAQGVVVLSSLVSAALVWQSSGLDLAEFAASDAGAGLLLRTGAGMGALFAAEEVRLRSSLKLGKGAGRLLAGATAGLLFCAGETVIGLLHEDLSLVDATDRLAENAAIFALAEGGTLGILYLAGSSGSAAGPVGIAVAVGITLVVQGARMAWDAVGEREVERRIFPIRCKLALEELREQERQALQELLHRRP